MQFSSPEVWLLFAVLITSFDSALCLARSKELPQSSLSQQQSDDNFWLLKHIDEQFQDETSKLLLRQQSNGTRSSELVHLAVANQLAGLNQFNHYKFNSGNLQQDLINLKLVAGGRVDDETCKRHLEQILELIEDLSAQVELIRRFDLKEIALESWRGQKLEERHFRLAYQLDSFGRYQSGQLGGGKYHSFGMYDQCIRSPLLLTSQPTGRGTLVESRYCWAHLGVAEEHLSKPIRENRRSISANDRDESAAFHMAICLPATCHSATFISLPSTLKLVQKLIDTQFQAPESIYVNGINWPVKSVFCLVDDDSQLAALSLGGKLLIIFIALWLLICAYATFTRPQPSGSDTGSDYCKFLLSQMDLSESWRDFILVKNEIQNSELIDFSALNLISPLSGLALFLVHANIIVGPLNATPSQLEANLEMFKPIVQRLTLPSLLLVDSFFVLFWMKITFVLLEGVGQNYGHSSGQSATGWRFCKLWLYTSARLGFRVIPLYFLMFWFKKSLYVQLGSGPLWDFGLNEATSIGACQRETWPNALKSLALASTEPILGQCLPQSWLISNALLFALILPPIIILLRDQFNLACLFALLATIASLNQNYSIYSTMKPDALKLQLDQFQLSAMFNVFKLASYIYTNPFNRIPVAMVGVFAGYALVKYKQKLTQTGIGTTTSVAWPNWFRQFATRNAISFVVVSLLMSLLVHEIGLGTSLNFKKVLMNYFVLSGHLNWALASAVIFLRLATDCRDKSYLLQLASSRLCRATSKLTLPLWLIHWDLLAYGVQISGQSQNWNYAQAISMALVNMIAIGPLIHVGFENPANKLIRALCNRNLLT